MSPNIPTRISSQPIARDTFCQIAPTPEIDYIDRPNPAELRQDVLVKLLQRTTDPATCEALVEAEPKLTSVLYRNARSDFFRNRVGRKPVQLVSIDTTALEHLLSEPDEETGLPLLLDARLVNRTRSLGRPLIREVIDTMLTIQRARRRGKIPNELRQKIYRLRRKTGLPLRTDLL